METIVLVLVLDTYTFTWLPGSRTQLGHFRICEYKELRPVRDPGNRYRWYLRPYLHTRCAPYVIHEIEIEQEP